MITQNNKPLKIAYATTYNAHDVYAWSGLGNYIFKALKATGNEIVPIGDLHRSLPSKVITKSKKLIYNKVFKKRYLSERDPMVLSDYARQVEAGINGSDFDWVVSPGSLPVSAIATDVPIAIWTDATFASLIGFYEDLKHQKLYFHPTGQPNKLSSIMTFNQKKYAWFHLVLT